MNDDIKKARDFAIKWHGKQKYGDKSYVYHLDQVYNQSLLEDDSWAYGNNDIRITAYLHDVLEDTECQYHQIVDEFGYTVADAVMALTKHDGEDYDVYIKRVMSDSIAHVVKIADTKCNLKQSILDDNKRFIVKYAKQLYKLGGLD